MKEYKDISYSLKQSSRKTMSIYVEPDGQVSVLAPNKLSQEEIEKLIEDKRYWIYTQQAEFDFLNKHHRTREFVNGESFLYLGRTYQLEIVGEQRKNLKFAGERFYLHERAHHKAYDEFKRFYRTKGLVIVQEYIDKQASALEVEPGDVRVMELGSRWGSCSEKTLNIHWKAIMAPRSILEYIVVHELVQLIHPTHSTEFWDTVDKILPNYWERKKWLREKGASLNI